MGRITETVGSTVKTGLDWSWKSAIAGAVLGAALVVAAAAAIPTAAVASAGTAIVAGAAAVMGGLGFGAFGGAMGGLKGFAEGLLGGGKSKEDVKSVDMRLEQAAGLNAELRRQAQLMERQQAASSFNNPAAENANFASKVQQPAPEQAKAAAPAQTQDGSTSFVAKTQAPATDAATAQRA